MYLLQRLTHLLLVFSALWVAIILVVKKKENFVTNQELFKFAIISLISHKPNV